MNNNNKYGDGSFEFIEDDATREFLIDFHKAICFTNNWEYIKNYHNEQYDFYSIDDTSQRLIISNKLEELGSTGHSFNSFNYGIKNMNYIANNGIEKFKEKYKNKNDLYVLK
jgi:hypothetical protein